MGPERQRATAVAVVALLGLAQTAAGRELLYQGGSTAVKASAFGDEANFFWTTGNGSWVQMSGDRTVNLVTDFVPRTTDLGVGHPAAGEGGAYSVTFPSKYLGVAVGASPAAGIDATANAYTLLSSGTTATVTSQQVLAAEVPTILVSVDGSNSWARATGVVGKTRALVPDLFGVTCASRTLCWAVGGSVVAADTVATAAILMTTVGPGSWSYVLCPSNFATGAASDRCNAGNYLPDTDVANDVAALLAVTSDSAGRNVFAVGAQRTPSDNTPPILYSGNSGMSWVMQVAPAISNAGAMLEYSLTTVAAATGKVVYAAGGDLVTNVNGVILLTVNGGFTWLQQTIQVQYVNTAAASFAATTTVGAYYGIAYNRNKAVDATVWAVGAPMDITTGSCFNIVKVYLPTGVASASAFASFVTVPSSSLPPALGLSCNPDSALYGIVWDNPLHGWIFGEKMILVTYDGGNNWMFETPNLLAVGVSGGATNPTKVMAMANVPSNY